MGLKSLPLIAGQLLQGGLPPETPAAVIVAATTPEQQVLVSTLDRIAAEAVRQNLSTPALVVVGSIVSMHGQLCMGAAE